MTPSARDPRVEGEILGRYLLGRAVPPEAIERYVAGCSRLLDGPVAREDAALLATVLRRPWTLPCLDAVCGLLRPRSLLRQKLILMLAVLETMPEQAPDFLPAGAPRAVVLLRLTASGAAAALKTLCGLLILPAVRWRS